MLSWPLPQDPDAYLDYQFDWSTWLQPGETIVTSVFLIENVLLPTLVLDQESVAGGLTEFWARGGIDGENYDITNRITTNQGRKDDKTSRLRIRSSVRSA